MIGPALRRLSLLIILAGLGLIGLALWQLLRPAVAPIQAPVAASELPRPESVLMLTMDTTRADHLRPYSPEAPPTPALEELAGQGLVFEQAQAVAPITLPAHSSILTGLYPPQHGVRTNGVHSLPAEVPTLATILRERGFATGAFVSAAVLERRFGLNRGFDVYDDDLSTGRLRLPRMVADRPAEATIDAALAWLDGLPADRPFFLWVHLYDPHAPYSPPPPWRDQWRDNLYKGEICYMDAQIARLLGHARIADADKTVVAALGDHGESLGEHGEATHGLLAYESTLHVPFLLRFPGAKPGGRFAPPVSQVDLVPTLLDLLDVGVPAELGGQSLAPLLAGGAPAEPTRPLYAEAYLSYYTYGWAPLRVLRAGMNKYIDAPEPELYDLRRDPRELSDQVEQARDLAHDLRRDLAEWRDKLERHVAAENVADAELFERFRGLGYLALSAAAPGEDDASRPNPMDMIGLHVLLERARTLAQNQLPEQALLALDDVLAEDPSNVAALIDRAAVLGELGQLDQAAETLGRAIELERDQPRLPFLLAGIESRRGRPGRALELLDIALEQDPMFDQAVIAKAQQLQRLNRPDEARALLEQALAAEPENPRLLTAAAQLLDLPAGELDQAKARLDLAIQRDPFSVWTWMALGETAELRREPAEAVGFYQRGLERAPDNGGLHARLGVLMARTGQDAAVAEQHLREAIRLELEGELTLRVSLGALLAEQGRLAEAETEYRRVLEERPEDPATLNNLAVAFYSTGRREEARKLWTDLAERSPRNADVWNNLAALDIEAENWSEAEQRASRALKLSPRMPEAWNNLGLARQGAGRLAEAEAAYVRALEEQPSYWEARLNLALTRIQAGKAAQGAHMLEELIRERPGVALPYLELARVCETQLEDVEKARRYYRAYLRLASQGPGAEFARERLEGL